MHRRKVQTVGQNLDQFLAVIGDAAARTAQRKAGPDEDGKTILLRKVHAIAEIVHQHGLRNIEADAYHCVLEEQAVLSLLDGFELGADHLHAVFIENPGIGKIDSQIERRLSAHSRQQGKLARARPHHRCLYADDLFHIGDGQRLNVRAVGKLRVRHDGSWVGVHQHHFIAIGLERLAGLRAGVVELGGLANHNRPRADHKYLLDVISAWHSSLTFYLGGQFSYGRSVGRIGNMTRSSHFFASTQVKLRGGSKPATLVALPSTSLTGTSRNSPDGTRPKSNSPLSFTAVDIRTQVLCGFCIRRMIWGNIAPDSSSTIPLTFADSSMCRLGRTCSSSHL